MTGRVLALLGLLGACAGAPARSPVESTPSRCSSSPIASGDVLVGSEDDARTLAGCREVRGDLVIKGGRGLHGLSSLERVTGAVRIESALTLSDVSGLGSLRSIGGALIVRETYDLSGLFLGKLERVGGDIRVRDATIRNLSLHRLEWVGGSMRIENNDALWRVDLSALTTVRGRLVVRGNRLLETLHIPTLTTVGARDVQKLRGSGSGTGARSDM